MARRAGKAASRKARQRYVPKTPRPAPDPAPAAEAAVVVPPVGTPDARQATSLDQPRRTAPVTHGIGSGSVLSTRERAEYHYVERDLRNIGVLSLVMVVLLVGAYFLFNAIGLVG
jgi:hypothetical protein